MNRDEPRRRRLRGKRVLLAAAGAAITITACEGTATANLVIIPQCPEDPSLCPPDAGDTPDAGVVRDGGDGRDGG